MDKILRTEKLRAIMKIRHLSAGDVGAILGRSAQTVRAWRCKDNSRAIPALALKVLEAATKK